MKHLNVEELQQQIVKVDRRIDQSISELRALRCSQCSDSRRLLLKKLELLGHGLILGGHKDIALLAAIGYDIDFRSELDTELAEREAEGGV